MTWAPVSSVYRQAYGVIFQRPLPLWRNVAFFFRFDPDVTALDIRICRTSYVIAPSGVCQCHFNMTMCSRAVDDGRR